jgi:hypothetical protein
VTAPGDTGGAGGAAKGGSARRVPALAAACRAAWRREDGTATLEFVLYFPAFVMILLASVEAGIMMTRQVMLERGFDIAMRELRLGSWENPDHAGLKDRICDNTATVRFCRDNLLIELAPVQTANWHLPSAPVTCVDRDEEIQPVTAFVPGAGNQLMMVRACYVVDPIFPTTRLGLQLPRDASGGFQMVTVSSFVNEPR